MRAFSLIFDFSITSFLLRYLVCAIFRTHGNAGTVFVLIREQIALSHSSPHILQNEFAAAAIFPASLTFPRTEGVGSVFFRRRSVSQRCHNIHTRARCFSSWGAIVLSFNRYRCFVVPAEAPSAASAWVSDLADWEMPVCQPTLPILPLFACELQITAQQRQACSRQRQGFALSSAPCSRLWVLCHMTLAEIDPPPQLKEMLRRVEVFLFLFYQPSCPPPPPRFPSPPTTHTLSQKTRREAVPGARWTEWQWPDHQDSSTFLSLFFQSFTWGNCILSDIWHFGYTTHPHAWKHIHLTNALPDVNIETVITYFCFKLNCIRQPPKSFLPIIYHANKYFLWSRKLGFLVWFVAQW